MSSLVGVSVLDTYSAAAGLQTGKMFGLGDFHRDDVGRAYVYVQASVAIAAGDVVLVSPAYAASLATTAAATRGTKVGVAPVAFAANEYGWVQVDGTCSAINVLASCVANVRLNTTATAGKLDDDGTATTKQIEGIFITTTNGGATASQPGILTIPMVSVTL